MYIYLRCSNYCRHRGQYFGKYASPPSGGISADAFRGNKYEGEEKKKDNKTEKRKMMKDKKKGSVKHRYVQIGNTYM
jgi:hypothetical protein